jgi:hypothetical protein
LSVLSQTNFSDTRVRDLDTVGIPIPGSRTIERIEENARGAELELSVEAIKEIRELVDKAEVAGSRNPSFDWLLAGVEGNSLPLAEWKGEKKSCWLQKPFS